MSSAIHLEGVLFRWPGQTSACLTISDFDIGCGESVFLHGESGSGKSTLLALLGGVLVPQQGTLLVLNTDLSRLSASRRDRFRVRHIGFIFQQFNLVPYLSVVENVLLPCRFSDHRRQRAAAQSETIQLEARRLLAHLDLARELWDRTASLLSVGQQQRVAVARALIGQPEIVIADEPTSALDAGRQAAFLELLGRECEQTNTTLIYVSHDTRLAPHFSRSVALSEINRAGTTAVA